MIRWRLPPIQHSYRLDDYVVPLLRVQPGNATDDECVAGDAELRSHGFPAFGPKSDLVGTNGIGNHDDLVSGDADIADGIAGAGRHRHHRRGSAGCRQVGLPGEPLSHREQNEVPTLPRAGPGAMQRGNIDASSCSFL